MESRMLLSLGCGVVGSGGANVLQPIYDERGLSNWPYQYPRRSPLEPPQLSGSSQEGWSRSKQEEAQN